MKKSASVLHYFGLDCGMFGRKDRGSYLYNVCAEEVGGLEAFLYEAAQNFEVFSNIQN